jgi:hypothetical protein
MRNLPVLVICFRRPHYLQLLLNRLSENPPSSVYISIDAQRLESTIELELVRECFNIANKFASTSGIPVTILQRKVNLGSAVNVITSIDWFFSLEEEGVILEEDCIPSNTFIDYAKVCLDSLKKEDRVLIVSGTRPLTLTPLPPGALLSHLPFNWGWATTGIKWKVIKELIVKYPGNYKYFQLPFISAQEMFLFIGAKRALRGWNDVWDTILASSMLRRNYFSLIPPINMISNIGVDSLGLNTREGDPQLMRQASDVYITKKDLHIPKISEVKAIDKIIYKEVLEIKFKHRILPPLKYFIQIILRWNKGRGNLKRRLESNNV